MALKLPPLSATVVLTMVGVATKKVLSCKRRHEMVACLQAAPHLRRLRRLPALVLIKSGI